MKASYILILFGFGIGIVLGGGKEEISGKQNGSSAPRQTRTISRFFGLDSSSSSTGTQATSSVPTNVGTSPIPQQAVPSQPPFVRKPVPLVYSVKYYDRTGGDGDKIDIVQEQQSFQTDRVHGVPARVFLNLYNGQQSPVYYDGKGQILVPCPVYDHLYLTTGVEGVVRKPFVASTGSATTVSTGTQPASSSAVTVKTASSPNVVPEIIYYATPTFLQPNPVQQPKPTGTGGFAVVGVPYDYPSVFQGGLGGVYPFGSGLFNPYFYLKQQGIGVAPASHLHHHGSSTSPLAGIVGQSIVTPIVVEKKEGEKTD